MRRAVVAAVVGVVVALGACGVPKDDQARRIGDDDVPFGLLDERSPETSTTVGAPQSPASVYYVQGDRLVEAARDLAAPADVRAALDALAAGPTGAEAARGVRSALPEKAFEEVAVRDGVADVDLAAAVVDLETGEQLLAIAQIVHTATGRPGVKAVRFRLEGRLAEVPIDGANLVTRPVTRDDYRSVSPPA